MCTLLATGVHFLVSLQANDEITIVSFTKRQARPAQKVNRLQSKEEKKFTKYAHSHTYHKLSRLAVNPFILYFVYYL